MQLFLVNLNLDAKSETINGIVEFIVLIFKKVCVKKEKK